MKSTTHPLTIVELLACWLFSATLSQITHTIIMLNLQLVKLTNGPAHFWIHHLISVTAFPTITIGILYVLGNPRVSVAGKAAAFLTGLGMLTGIDAAMHTFGLIAFTRWSMAASLVKHLLRVSASVLFMVLFVRLWRKRGLLET